MAGLAETLRRSRERFRTILDSMEEAYFELDLSGNYTFFNDFLCRSFGFSREELMGMNYKSYTNPEFARKAYQIFHEIYLTGKPNNQVEFEIIKKDGSKVTLEMSLALITDPSGEPVGFRGVSRDITSRILAEQALKESEERYRTIFENTGNATILIGEDMTILLVNSNFEKLSGYSKQEMERKLKWTGFIADEDLEMMKRYHKERREDPGNPPASYEFRFKKRSGELRNMFLTVSMIPGTKESVASCMDITERKHVEDELLRSEERYRNILDSMDEAYYETDLSGNITNFNASTMKILEYSHDEIMGESYKKLTDKGSISKVFDLFHKVFLTGEPFKMLDWELISKSGKKVVVESSISLNRDARGNIIGFKGIGRDITERKKAEKALFEQLHFSQQLLDAIPVPVFHKDTKGVYLGCNRAFEGFIGLSKEQVVGMTVFDIYPQDLAKIYYEADEALFNRPGVQVYETSMLHADGCNHNVIFNKATYVDTNGRVVGIVGGILDITELRRAEQEKKGLEFQLLQAQKMEALGRFAGGIAHDLNNILYPIIIDTELLLDEVAAGTDLHETLKHVLSAAYRQRDLVKQILSFSRRSDQKFIPMAVSPLIKETVQFVRSTLPSTLELKYDISASSDMILGDPTQIQQILMNLCRNAVDSMDAQTGTIEVSLTDAFLEPASEHAEIHSGQYLKLAVRDTGCGIAPEIMDRIFEPFFTTKEIGKGSGMGLAVIHGILKNHRGAINVRSEPGKGSLFEVFLPVINGKANDMTHVEKTPSVKGKEKVLLVDDDEIVLTSMQRALKHSGYEVTAIRDGHEALELFVSEPDVFDLVITDLTMPRITGLELSKKLTDIRPGLPVILCTGYSDSFDEQEARDMGVREMLLKPSNAADLNTIVRRALAE